MKAIRLRLYPNKQQSELIDKHFGCCRWIYNYGLQHKIEYYNKNKKTLSMYDISSDLPKLKIEFPWLKEVNSQSLQQSLKDLDSAFSHFFRKDNKFPKFKSKKYCKYSYRIPQNFNVDGKNKKIKLPKLGKISYKQKFKFHKDLDLRNVTVSRDSLGHYYATVVYDDKSQNFHSKNFKLSKDKILGIDGS